MKKCVFIIPYFGKFNNYFDLFLLSCEKNKNYNWIIFTDDRTEYNYPSNVKVIYMSFSNLKEIINSKFDFEVCLDRPYKLCDYRPAYGYIFSEYIKDFLFWGHCDLDLIFGNLDSFISNELLDEYDKIFTLGHLTLYRNNEENNKRFMLPFRNKLLYKEVFQDRTSRNFDEEWYEENVNAIFLDNNIKVFQEDYSANPCLLPTKFTLTKYQASIKKYVKEEFLNSLFVWDEGEVYRIFKNKDGNELIKEKFLYIHLQQRKMKNHIKTDRIKKYKIIPNAFKEIEFPSINIYNFDRISKKNMNMHSLKIYYNGIKDKLK